MEIQLLFMYIHIYKVDISNHNRLMVIPKIFCAFLLSIYINFIFQKCSCRFNRLDDVFLENPLVKQN